MEFEQVPYSQDEREDAPDDWMTKLLQETMDKPAWDPTAVDQ